MINSGFAWAITNQNFFGFVKRVLSHTFTAARVSERHVLLYDLWKTLDFEDYLIELDYETAFLSLIDNSIDSMSPFLFLSETVNANDESVSAVVKTQIH